MDSGPSSAGQQSQPQQSRSASGNPDMSAAVNKALRQIDLIHTGQEKLLMLWQHKKVKLDQCFQGEDVGRGSDVIADRRGVAQVVAQRSRLCVHGEPAVLPSWKKSCD